jgi:hypothetical protein
MRAENQEVGRRRPSPADAEEPWRVMVFVWQAITAALLPIALRDVPALLGPFRAHLARDGARCRERRAAQFVRRLRKNRA